MALVPHFPGDRQGTGGIQRHRPVREDRQQGHGGPQRQPGPRGAQVFGTAV